MLSLVYDSFRYTKFQCEETEGGFLFTATLDQDGMKKLMVSVVPQSEEMDISYEAGTIQLRIGGNEIEGITIICGGGTQIGVIDANVNLDVHISFPDENFTKELPDTVTAALMHKEE